MNRLLAVLLVGAAALASAATLPPGTIPFRSYGAETGLGNLSAMKLAQDASGYLWVATQEGLYRYDGTRFTRFGIEQGLPSAYVSLVHAAADGGVWAGTFAGAARLRGMRFETAADLPHVLPNAITTDASSRAWIATKNGLFVQSGSHFVAATGWPSPREATAVWFDARRNAIWAAAESSIGCFAGNEWRWWQVTPAERIDNVVVDRDGVVWARSGNHLWMNFADATSALPATSNNGYLSLDRRGNLWVPTDRGVAVHDANGWRVIGGAEGLPVDWARDVLEDREGSIWIASLGIHRMLGRGELTSYRRANGLPNDVTWCFRRDGQGRLLVGTDLGLARSFEVSKSRGSEVRHGAREGAAEPRNLETSKPAGWSVVPGTEGRQIRTVVLEPDGTIWAAGSPPEIVRIAPDGGVRTFAARGRTILRLLHDRSGVMWAATRGGGLLRKAPQEEQFSEVALPNGASDEEFRDVMEDRAGRIWAAGQRGLACLSGATWRRYTAADGLARDFVAYVAEAANGDVWVAYFEPSGVARIRVDDGGRLHVVQALSTKNGLSADKAFLIGEDTHGRLWAGTGVGVDVVGPNGIEHIGSADGLAGDDTDAQAFLADRDGDVFVGTSSGFTRIAGSGELAPPQPPRVVITTARREAQNFYAEFSALSFVKPAAIEYETRLAGLDDNWQHDAEPHVRLSRIPPGDYRFEVRARVRPGAWSEPASYAIVIDPMWWQTWWARAGGVVLALAILWLGYRWRVAFLRRRNAELQALVEQRTRELAAANESLMQLSVTDALTGMHNRRFLDIAMPQFVSDSVRRHESLSRSGIDISRANADLVFFMLDLDHFKEVNDRWGHAAGDAVLKQLERLLREVMRDSDTLVRWGGEEFLFVARNASRAEAPALAERIRVAVDQHEFFVEDDRSIRMTCSIGFAAFPFLPEDAMRFSWHDVVDVADVCLYAAKRAGRNRWIGAAARDVREPETLLARIRTGLHGAVAAGDVELVTSRRNSSAPRGPVAVQ